MATKLSYGEQLKHPFWQKRRLEILGRDEFTCQGCFDKESTLHVHHKHYIKGRLAWEYSGEELITLCESCHEGAAENDEEHKMLLAKLNFDGPYSLHSALSIIAGWAHQHCGHDLAAFYEKEPHGFTLGEVVDLFDDFDIVTLKAFVAAMHTLDRAGRESAVETFIERLQSGHA